LEDKRLPYGRNKKMEEEANKEPAPPAANQNGDDTIATDTTATERFPRCNENCSPTCWLTCGMFDLEFEI
jgi:hypothetical protein